MGGTPRPQIFTLFIMFNEPTSNFIPFAPSYNDNNNKCNNNGCPSGDMTFPVKNEGDFLLLGKCISLDVNPFGSLYFYTKMFRTDGILENDNGLFEKNNITITDRVIYICKLYLLLKKQLRS